MGGGNESENLVDMLPEQHYVAHLLLVKMYPGNRQLIYAAHCMRLRASNQQRNNKTYAWLKRLYAKECAVVQKERMTGKRRNPETKEKIRQAHLGKKHTLEHRKNNALARLGSEPWNRGKKYNWVVYPRHCLLCDFVAQNKHEHDYHRHYYHGRRIENLRITAEKPKKLISYPRKCDQCEYTAENSIKYHSHKKACHSETIKSRQKTII